MKETRKKDRLKYFWIISITEFIRWENSKRKQPIADGISSKGWKENNRNNLRILNYTHASANPNKWILAKKEPEAPCYWHIIL